MICIYEGQFVMVSKYDFKGETGEALTSYKVLLMDSDEIRDDAKVKPFKVSNKAILEAKFDNPEVLKKTVGLTLRIIGKTKPKYRKNSLTWVNEFVGDKIILLSP